MNYLSFFMDLNSRAVQGAIVNFTLQKTFILKEHTNLLVIPTDAQEWLLSNAVWY